MDPFHLSQRLTKNQAARSRIVTESHELGSGSQPTIEVTRAKVQEVVIRSAPRGVTTVLNFASAKNPGGGVLRGAKAQEEDICRCSGLYQELAQPSMASFYKDNEGGPPEYYDGLILSEGVWMVLDESYRELPAPVIFNAISCPAPNMHRKKMTREKAQASFQRRTRLIIQVAEEVKTQNLILGAWGCGVFGNDPKMVALAFQEALKDTAGPSLKYVQFAIYGNPHMAATFEDVFEP